MLKKKKFRVGAMHSDLEQEERDRVMLDFKNNKLDILVATDIVARGIDIDQIGLVINYDVPRDPEDYIHRIGRTARANADGRAITFVSEDDQVRFLRIERFLGYEVRKECMPEELGEAPDYKPAPVKSNRGRARGKGRYRGKSVSNNQSSDQPTKNARRRPHQHNRHRNRKAGNGQAGGNQQPQ